MDKEQVAKEIRYIVAANLMCDEEKVTLESRIVEDLGADSLSIVEIVMDIELAIGYPFVFPDSLVAECRTVGDLVKAAQQVMEERAT